MPIAFSCSTCAKPFTVGDHLAGKRSKCPGCGAMLQVPSATDTKPAADPPYSPPARPPLPPPVAPPPVIQDAIPTPHYPQHQQYQQPHPQQYSGHGPPQMGFQCPFCHTQQPPYVQSQISTAGWVLFVVLLIFCFPLCIIGLFIKENYRVCSGCGIKLG